MPAVWGYARIARRIKRLPSNSTRWRPPAKHSSPPVDEHRNEKQIHSPIGGVVQLSSTFRISGCVAEGVRKPLQKADRDLDGLRAGP